MKPIPSLFLALTCLGAAMSAPALAGGDQCHEHGAPPARAMHSDLPMRDGPPPRQRGPEFLRDIELSESQQQKIFSIMHAREPEEFEQAAALRKAHEALRAMSTSGEFDEARAAALAQAAGKASAGMALGRARAEAQVLALLTPDQRKQASRDLAPSMPPRQH